MTTPSRRSKGLQALTSLLGIASALAPDTRHGDAPPTRTVYTHYQGPTRPRRSRHAHPPASDGRARQKAAARQRLAQRQRAGEWTRSGARRTPTWGSL